MFRSLYDWVLKQAGKPYAEATLFCVAFAEASFFPLPPDLLLIPMVVASREKAFRFALTCTAGSVLGALLGYGIGSLAMASIGAWIIQTYHLDGVFQAFHDGFNKWGVLIILIKGLTPIPFKLVTIASGAAHLDLVSFVLASLVTRGARFFLIAALLYKFGKPIQTFIEKYLTFVMFGILILIVLGFWLVVKV